MFTMHHKNLKITSIHNVHNRGKAAMTDILYDSDFLANFEPGDTFRYEDKVYKIKSVEAALTIKNDKRVDVIAFICNPITTKELWETNKNKQNKENLIQKIIKKIKSWVAKSE